MWTRCSRPSGRLYRDDTIYHVATPALYQVEGKWYLYAQACPRPDNDNYIDGRWTCGASRATA